MAGVIAAQSAAACNAASPNSRSTHAAAAIAASAPPPLPPLPPPLPPPTLLPLLLQSPKEADAKALLRLLSPTGMLFTAMYSADADGSTQFFFPKERLPTHTQVRGQQTPGCMEESCVCLTGRGRV